MNDRYLYRAKRTDNGEWTYGYLYGIWERKYILWGMTNDVPNMTEVDTSTLCQCTGLKDKNGNMIWENDIVDLYDRNTDYKWRAVVRFGNPNYEYTWGWQLEPIGKCEANTDILCWIEMEESGATCEVIGNIFDNPEL